MKDWKHKKVLDAIKNVLFMIFIIMLFLFIQQLNIGIIYYFWFVNLFFSIGIELFQKFYAKQCWNWFDVGWRIIGGTIGLYLFYFLIYRSA